MKKLFDKLKGQQAEQAEEEYLEVDANPSDEKQDRIYVKPFVLEDFSDVKGILNSLREGNTIILVEMKKLREKDLLELKRAVAKIKKTVDTINGDIRGFGEDHLIVVPGFVEVLKSEGAAKTDNVETYE